LRGYILLAGGFFLDQAISSAAAKSQFQKAQERFAQCGVQLKLAEGAFKVVAANPKGVVFGGNAGGDFNEPYTEKGTNKLIIPDESRAMFDALKTAKDEIGVYFVARFNPASAKAATTVRKVMPPSLLVYADKIVLDSEAISGYSLSHEVLHSLMNAVHGEPWRDFMNDYNDVPFSLWHDVSLEPGIFFERKRIKDEMVSRVLVSPLAQ
ncbi:MAG TPA: hypothetical protein VGO11_13185, partial [Chthoniobacteraceae bacterium]|nr:hypothetical protein [Chthoniobacteraceae bacterium]